MLVILRSLDMVKKETDKHNYKLPGCLSQYEIHKKSSLKNFSYLSKSSNSVSKRYFLKEATKIYKLKTNIYIYMLTKYIIMIK